MYAKISFKNLEEFIMEETKYPLLQSFMERTANYEPGLRKNLSF